MKCNRISRKQWVALIYPSITVIPQNSSICLDMSIHNLHKIIHTISYMHNVANCNSVHVHAYTCSNTVELFKSCSSVLSKGMYMISSFWTMTFLDLPESLSLLVSLSTILTGSCTCIYIILALHVYIIKPVL